MKKKTVIIGAVVLALGTAALGAASYAGRDRLASGFHGMHGGSHMGGHMSGHMGGPHGGAMMGKMMKTLDGDQDGKLTQAEIDTAIKTRLAKFDADTNGELGLEEFAALWSDFMRERMVDHFQVLDADGNATVTLEEFQSPFAQAVERFDRNGDGALSSEDHRGGHRRHYDDDKDNDD